MRVSARTLYRMGMKGMFGNAYRTGSESITQSGRVSSNKVCPLVARTFPPPKTIFSLAERGSK